jgi:molybdenum cofactor cytidylyltransferase
VRFEEFPLADAEGAVLAHSVRTRGGLLKKGRVLTAGDVAWLAEAGLARVMAARLEAGDVPEDRAAARLARALAGDRIEVAEPFTGRANLFAATDGLTLIEPAVIAGINAVDEAVTVATVAPYERVVARQMVATVKIIPFAVAEAAVAAAEAAARMAPLRVAPFRRAAAGLILTRLDGTKPAVIEKRREIMAHRLAALGGAIAKFAVVPHAIGDVAREITEQRAAGCDPILVFAASAIVDRADVVPAGLIAAGGEVVRLGMPVDPGNLMLLGRLGDGDVVGVPSCAGSPKLNGFDWVLERLVAGLPVGPADIAAMGLGGLLKEIATRPQPRESEPKADGPRRAPAIAAIVLAAGRSSRMGERHKLLEPVAGKPIVRHAVEAAMASSARPVLVVTGHRAEDVERALAGCTVQMVASPHYKDGLSASLRAGIKALPPDVDGALILLADMPGITARHIDALISAFAPKEGRSIVLPVRAGKRGNPVLWGRDHFAELAALAGDSGARHLIGEHGERVAEVDLGSDAIFLDIDTPEGLAEARRAAGESTPGGQD